MDRGTEIEWMAELGTVRTRMEEEGAPPCLCHLVLRDGFAQHGQRGDEELLLRLDSEIVEEDARPIEHPVDGDGWSEGMSDPDVVVGSVMVVFVQRGHLLRDHHEVLLVAPLVGIQILPLPLRIRRLLLPRRFPCAPMDLEYVLRDPHFVSSTVLPMLVVRGLGHRRRARRGRNEPCCPWLRRGKST